MPRSLPCLLCIGLCFPLFLVAQASNPLVWSRVSPADLALRYFPDDPSAPALVLGDEMAVGFFFDDNIVELRAERHRRIKYFERFAYAQDPVRIEWHEPTEEISRLRAILHLPDGKKSRLRKKDFRIEALGQGWQQYVLTLTDVPAGAVLEYRYRLSSESLDELPRFYFQEQYPVRRKAFVATIPDWFEYLTLAEPGEEYLVTRRFSEYNATLPIPYTGLRAITALTEMQFVAADLPAIPVEPMSNNIFDYVPQVRMRLNSVNWPTEEPRALYKSWDEMAEQLRADSTFGEHYLAPDSLAAIRRALPDSLSALPDPLARARVAYRILNERLRWTGEYGAWTNRSPAQIWSAGSGHSGELNLVLLTVLRDLGIEAYPVLGRTRNSGVPIEQMALLEQFDHLLVLAQLEDRIYFFDLGNPYRPAGLPRIAALNNRGWLVTDQGQTWINLSTLPSEQVIQAELTLDSTGLGQGTLQAKMTGYYAAAAREQLQLADGAKAGPLIDMLQSYYPGTKLLGRTVRGKDSLAAPLGVTLDCSIPLGKREEDRLVLTPVLFPSLDLELATAEPRQFPLDSPYPWAEQYTLFLNLPPGYAVETLPEPVKLDSPDGGVSFLYQAGQNGQRLILAYRLAVNKTLYTPEEYERTIRDLFFTAIDRQEGVVVLRREVPADR